MKKILFFAFVLFVLLFAYLFLSNKPNIVNQILPGNNIVNTDIATSGQKETNNVLNSTSSVKQQIQPDFTTPLSRVRERITKKTFGTYITPQNSPIQPEKFSGYHTGLDFEVFPDELDKTVEVRAVCSGELIFKKNAAGYGGVAVQECQLNNEPITVIYGHLKLASMVSKIGDDIKIGDTIGALGMDKSRETDGERKHLHLGMHKGTVINIKGYVSSKNQLTGWIDPCLYICQN